MTSRANRAKRICSKIRMAQEESSVKKGTGEGSKVSLSTKFAEEWLKILPKSSNAQNANVHAFRDAYSFCRDAQVPHTNGTELFWFFYKNRVQNVPVSNPWTRNLGKLIVPEVYMDVDLIKALVNAYNPTTWPFHRKDMSILCTLSKDAFVEAFDLQGPMSVPINLEKLEAAFEK